MGSGNEGEKMKDAGITVFICPRCQTRCSRMPHTGDFEHVCQGTEVLRNEDVLAFESAGTATKLNSTNSAPLTMNVPSLSLTISFAYAPTETSLNLLSLIISLIFLSLTTASNSILF